MVREIKFRAWDKEDKHMFKKIIHINFEDKFICFPNTNYERKFSEVILMQYTGMKDKNEVEIYEGDILSCKFKSTKIKDWVETFEVKYKGGSFNLDYYEDKIMKHHCENWEVIGNIYEDKGFNT